MTKSPDPGEQVIFRRYRRTKDGRVLDARKYGLKAWPIRVPAGDGDDAK